MSGTEISGKPRIALLGVPVEIGASQGDTLMGPAALRTAGIARVLEQLKLDVEDHGDLRIDGRLSPDGGAPAHARSYDEVKTWVRSLSERAWLLARSGAIPIFM
jgi:arginase